MEVIIRVAQAGDRDRCLELLTMLGSATQGNNHPRAAEVFERLLSRERGEVLIAEDDDDGVLGLASVSYNLAMRYGGEYCQLEELIVAPEARGKNAGALLVQATVERARQRGCAEYGLYLVETTEHNRPFYEKQGFTVVGTEMRQQL